MTPAEPFNLFAACLRPHSCLLLVAMAWIPVLPQTVPPAAATGTYRIAGTVVNAVTGNPLRRVTVAALAQEDSHTVESVETDANGHFSLDRLPAAKYQLTAAKRGFRTAFYDEHEEFSTAIVTGEGQDTTGLNFRIVPGAVLYGVVTGDGGDPVEGAKVLLFEHPRGPGASPGRGERITQADTATADDTGAYEFDGLAAGDYRLAVTAEPWFALHRSGARKRPATDGANDQDAALDVAYPVTFFDSTTDEASAARIVLADGGREEANIYLHAVPALRLMVETPHKQDGPVARAELRQTIFGTQISAESEGRLDAQGTGSVEFSGVAPGHYELVQGDPPRIAELDASASQQVDAALGTPAVAVSGMFRAASASASPQDSALPDDLTVTLESLDSTHRVTELQATALRGAFSFPLVPPGSWELWVESGGVQVPILSTSPGSRAVAGNRVTVRDQPLSLLVTLSLAGTRIEGFVRKDGKGVAGAMVVLVPSDPAALRALGRRDQSDSDGSFSLRDVAPGQYTVVAIQDGWDLDWTRPGVLSRFLARGVGVSVSDKSGKLIQLPAGVADQVR